MTLVTQTTATVRPIVAIYARYSCDKQNEDSLEDQIRRCRQLAEHKGLGDCEFLIYTDSAVSGTDKGDALRTGYRQLREDWEAGKFQILLVDEFSRLSRDPVEQAVLFKRLEINHRVRLITPDGINTQDEDWQLRLGLHGLIAQNESRKLRYRVGRGVVGRLEKGLMVGAPPFGYRVEHQYAESGKDVGIKWVIHPQEADIVKEIFDRREKGESMHKIASWLTGTGIASSKGNRKKKAQYWRASRVKNVLQNPIYKGVFLWHGSTTYAAKAKAQGLPEDAVPYARPELRLVSDETWERCNTRSISRTGYGGGKHALTGLVSCSICSVNLSMSALRRCRSLYCAHCTDKRSSTKDTENTLTATIAAEGVQLVLIKALEYFISPQFVEEFRASLRERLTGDKQADVDECVALLKKEKATQERLSRILTECGRDDEVLERRYHETLRKVKELQAKLTHLQAGMKELDVKSLKAQLEVDPRTLLPKLFDAGLPAHEVRSVLARLFPSVVFEGKQGRYLSTFRIRFAPGVALAQASGTCVVSAIELEGRFQLKYTPSNSKEKPGYWTVEVLSEQPAQAAKPKKHKKAKESGSAEGGAEAGGTVTED